MNRVQFAWWGYVRSMIRLHSQNQKRDDLSRVELLEIQAVNAAIKLTAEKADGRERLELIRMVYWMRDRVTIQRASLDLYISYSTAKRWHREFFLLVAEQFGLYDPPGK